MVIILTLLLAGAVLLLLETILPGWIAGSVGLGCMAAAVWVAYADYGVHAGHATLAIVVVSLVGGTLAWMKWLPESRLAQRFVSRSHVGPLGNERPDLLEQIGTALTNLRPSGTAMINGARVDVVSEGQMIGKGTPIRVVAVEGLRVVVRPQA